MVIDFILAFKKLLIQQDEEAFNKLTPEEQKEIFHPFNADILIYKSINRSENFEMYLNLKRL